MEDELCFAVRLSAELSLRIPCPSHEVGTAKELFSGRGTLVRRCPRVECSNDSVSLEFPKLPDERLQKHGRAGSVVTQVYWLKSVTTASEAANDLVQRVGERAKGLAGQTKACRRWTVWSIDLGKAGWAPGDEIVYLMSKDAHVGTILFSPTHWLQYEWSKVEVLWV